MEISIRNKTLIKMAGGHKCALSKLVNTSDPAVTRLLDVLCFNLAVFEDCKAEISSVGTVVEGPSGLKPHPAVNIMRNSSEMILRYCERLKIGTEAELDSNMEIDDLLGKRISRDATEG